MLSTTTTYFIGTKQQKLARLSVLSLETLTFKSLREIRVSRERKHQSLRKFAGNLWPDTRNENSLANFQKRAIPPFSTPDLFSGFAPRRHAQKRRTLGSRLAIPRFRFRPLKKMEGLRMRRSCVTPKSLLTSLTPTVTWNCILSSFSFVLY